MKKKKMFLSNKKSEGNTNYHGDVTDYNYSKQSVNLSEMSSIITVNFSTDGTKVFFITANYQLHEYSLSVAWDVTTMSFVRSVSYGGTWRDSANNFSQDGLIMTTMTNNRYFKTWSMSIPWDISTLSLVSNNLITFYHAGYFDDGFKAYCYNDTNLEWEIREYSIRYDVTSSYVVLSNILGTLIGVGGYRRLSPNGDKIYYSHDSRILSQSDMTIPFDISTSVNNNITKSIAPIGSDVGTRHQGFCFGDNGKKLYTTDYSFEYITQWEL